MGFSRICVSLAIIAIVFAPMSALGVYFTQDSQRLAGNIFASDEHFGSSVCLRNGLAVIGDEWSGSGPTGSAYVYEIGLDGKLSQSAHLTGNRFDTAWFGAAVATNGSKIVVGAPREHFLQTYDGGAYVFGRDSLGAWERDNHYFSYPFQSSYGYYGTSLDFSSNAIIVGAPGLPEFELDVGRGVGSAYIYSFDDSLPSQRLLPDTSGYEDFGKAVAIDGRTALVGAPGNGLAAARAFIFELDDTGTWQQVADLRGSGQSNSRFGSSVAISKDTIVIGDPQEKVGENLPGAAYIYRRDNLGTLQLSGHLTPSGQQTISKFGSAVDIDGGFVVVGAPRGQSSGSQYAGGAAYVYSQAGSENWSLFAELVPRELGSDAEFGGSIAIDGTTVLIGAKSEYFNSAAGSAYLFNLVPEPSSIGVASWAFLALAATRRNRRGNTCSHSEHSR